MKQYIYGKNPIMEALKGASVYKIYMLNGHKDQKIFDLCKRNQIPLEFVDKKEFDKKVGKVVHQGVMAYIENYRYYSIDEILNSIQPEKQPLLLMLDGLEDPHNLGSIIRTAETAGVHGIIIPKRRAAAVNSTVNKVSAGAVQYMKIARVTNISDSIQKLKEAGLWICGTDINTDKYYYNQDLTGPLGIVIGNEGAGMSEKVRKNCDFMVKIPMEGKVTSLNASVSTGIVVYESVKQRILKKNIDKNK